MYGNGPTQGAITVAASSSNILASTAPGKIYAYLARCIDSLLVSCTVVSPVHSVLQQGHVQSP